LLDARRLSPHVLLTRYWPSRKDSYYPPRHVARDSDEREDRAESETCEGYLPKKPPTLLLYSEEGGDATNGPAHETHAARKDAEEWPSLIWANQGSFLAHLTPALSRGPAKRDRRLERLVGRHTPDILSG